MSRPLFRVYAATLAVLAAVCPRASIGALAQATPAAASFRTALPATTVGTTSAPQTINVAVRTAGRLASVAIAPAGTTEFQLVPGGTCTTSRTYAAGDTCTVAVAVTPAAPGTASAAVALRNAGGDLLGEARVRATGLGAWAAFTPGLVDVAVPSAPGLARSFSALASSGAAGVYLADAATGQILRRDLRTGTTDVIATALPINDPVAAMGADFDGTLYLLRSSGTVERVDAGTAAITPVALPASIGGTVNLPTALAVDPHGHLLLAFASSVQRLQDGQWTMLAGGATPCADLASACGDGNLANTAQFSGIRSIAVDPDGNVLIVDTAASRIRRVDAATGVVSTVAGTGTPCRHAPCSDNVFATAANLGKVLAIAPDALGNLYLAEEGTGLRRIDAATGTLLSVLGTGETRFRSGPLQLAALRDGTVLSLEQASPATLGRFTAASASLTFAQTVVGQTSTDSVQTVTVSNLGNAPLTLATPAAGTNPSTTADFPLSNTQTCPLVTSSTTAQALAPGASCSLGVKFTPTAAGTVSGQIVLSEAATAATATANVAASPTATATAALTHTLLVQGIASAPAAQAGVALITLPSAPVYGQPLSIFVSVYGSGSGSPTPTGSVSFYEGATTLAANVALSGGTANNTVVLPSTGAHTYAVSYSGDSNYAASTQNTTINVTIARAASVFTVNLPTYQYGQNIRSTYVLSGQYSGTGIALPGDVVTYTLLDSAGNVVVTGVSNHAERVGSIDENAPLGNLNAGSYTLRLSYPGDGNFLPLQRDYPLTVAKGQQTITFDPIASPVTYGTAPITLSATSISGFPQGPNTLPITFSVLSGPGTISNGQLVVTGVGTIVIAADQPGNANYAPAAQVTQSVTSVRPVATIVWNTPSPIVVGTPLGSNQLNAVVLDPGGQPLPGTYTYTPIAGTVLPVGPATLNVSYVPNDTQHYGTVTLTASVTLTVRDLVTPAIAFAGGTVSYGSSLAPALNATASANGSAVAGTVVYTSNGTVLTPATPLPVGTYAVTATFTPADGANYRGGTATATITVTRGAVAMVLTSSVTPVLLNSSVTLTAKLGAAATGTVQFSIGANTLGNATVGSNGTATLTLSTLPAGSQTVTATYSGDGNYNGASATTTVVVADFTLALNSSSASSQTIAPGKVATYQFTLAPSVTTTLAGDVTLTLAGLPAGATYTVTPSTVAAGAGSTTVTLAVTAPATIKAAVVGSPLQRPTTLVAAALLLLPFSTRLRRKASRLRNAGVLATVLFAAALALTLTGCGTGVGYYDGGQLTSTLTLSANSGSLTHTSTVTLEVQ